MQWCDKDWDNLNYLWGVVKQLAEPPNTLPTMHFRPDHHRFVELNICIYQSCQTRTWTDAEHVDVSWQFKLHVHVPSFRPLLSLPHNYISLSLLSLTLRHCIAVTAKVTYSHEFMHKISQSICHFLFISLRQNAYVTRSFKSWLLGERGNSTHARTTLHRMLPLLLHMTFPSSTLSLLHSIEDLLHHGQLLQRIQCCRRVYGK